MSLNIDYSIENRFIVCEVILKNNQIIHVRLDNMDKINEIIVEYGRQYISQIVFYLNHPQHSFYYLILRNTVHRGLFIVEFFHYYNIRLQRLELSYIEQKRDYEMIMNLIRTTTKLEDSLVPYIVDPFINE